MIVWKYFIYIRILIFLNLLINIFLLILKVYKSNKGKNLNNKYKQTK